MRTPARASRADAAAGTAKACSGRGSRKGGCDCRVRERTPRTVRCICKGSRGIRGMWARGNRFKARGRHGAGRGAAGTSKGPGDSDVKVQGGVVQGEAGRGIDDKPVCSRPVFGGIGGGKASGDAPCVRETEGDLSPVGSGAPVRIADAFDVAAMRGTVTSAIVVGRKDGGAPA